MAYRYLTQLADVCRKAGLKVVEVDGWKTRGRPSSTGGFDPVAVLCHHTATRASSSDSSVLNLLKNGRSDLPGPLCQLGLGRDGTVYVVAAGRANHAGTAKSSGTVAGGDGNSLYIGIEAFNDGVGEKWPAVQYDAYVKLAAALCREVTGNSAATVRGHKETSVTGKIDPTFDMVGFRERVAKAIGAKAEPKPPKPPKTPKPRPDFTIGHCSGLWSAAPGDWREAVQAMKDAKATVITLTETTRDGLVKQIVPDGWDHARLDDEPGQSECSVLWSKRAWEDMGPAWATPLATTRFKTSKGFLRPPVTAITKPLRHRKTGLVALFRVSHDPSGIQGRTGFKGTAPRLRAHREATEARHAAWAQGRAKYPDSAVIDAADRNVDWRLPWVREWWAEEYPKLEPCWAVRMPDRGTFNDRVIDWTACSPQLSTVSARVLPTVSGFDHRPLVAAYAVTSA